MAADYRSDADQVEFQEVHEVREVLGVQEVPRFAGFTRFDLGDLCVLRGFFF